MISSTDLKSLKQIQVTLSEINSSKFNNKEISLGCFNFKFLNSWNKSINITTLINDSDIKVTNKSNQLEELEFILKSRQHNISLLKINRYLAQIYLGNLDPKNIEPDYKQVLLNKHSLEGKIIKELEGIIINSMEDRKVIWVELVPNIDYHKSHEDFRISWVNKYGNLVESNLGMITYANDALYASLLTLDPRKGTVYLQRLDELPIPMKILKKLYLEILVKLFSADDFINTLGMNYVAYIYGK